MDEKFAWDGFRRGAPVVLVSGCHIGDCHNIDTNHWTEKRVNRIRKKMSRMGNRPERLQFEWISAAESIRFAKKMGEMETIRRTVTSAEIEETIELLRNIKGARSARYKKSRGAEETFAPLENYHFRFSRNVKLE